MREFKFRCRYEQISLRNKEIVTRFYSFEDLLRFGECHSGEKLISRDEWTGLKDKNKKEIYEGDIVQLEGKYTYRVIFLSGQFGLNSPSCCRHCKDGTAWHMSLYEGMMPDHPIEILGNIYENPELLKEKADAKNTA